MTATTATGPQQPITDDEARLAVFQIIGSDIDHAWTGDWHKTLRDTAARWSPSRRQRVLRRLRRALHLAA